MYGVVAEPVANRDRMSTPAGGVSLSVGQTRRSRRVWPPISPSIGSMGRPTIDQDEGPPAERADLTPERAAHLAALRDLIASDCYQVDVAFLARRLLRIVGPAARHLAARRSRHGCNTRS
jgi:hypothetical protein